MLASTPQSMGEESMSPGRLPIEKLPTSDDLIRKINQLVDNNNYSNQSMDQLIKDIADIQKRLVRIEKAKGIKSLVNLSEDEQSKKQGLDLGA